MSPSGRSSPVDELARARLAFISAGQLPLGAPRRAVVETADTSHVDPGAGATAEPVAVITGTAGDGGDRFFDRFRLGSRQAIAVLLLLLCGVAVTILALGQSSASQLPVETAPVVSMSEPPVAPSKTPSPAVLRVHVLGAVASPGVVEVHGGAIVQDVVLAAGGLALDADPAELNLAAPVGDGQQIIVGTTANPRGEVVNQPAAAGSAGSDAQLAPINLNSATVEELEQLPGVGPVTAAAIVGWREEHGNFTTVADLQEVTGIGPKSFAKLESLVTT